MKVRQLHKDWSALAPARSAGLRPGPVKRKWFAPGGSPAFQSRLRRSRRNHFFLSPWGEGWVGGGRDPISAFP